MPRLTERIALVSGAGHGIGLAIAQCFAAEGAHVYLADIDAPAVMQAAEHISATGGKATGLSCDVSRGRM